MLGLQSTEQPSPLDNDNSQNQSVIAADAKKVVSYVLARFGSGAAADKQRAARAQWFLNNAALGNLVAAQCLLGGTINTASHESPMYASAVTALQSTAIGANLWQEAVAAGPQWSTADSAASYPIMSGWVSAYARQYGLPVASVTGATTAPPTGTVVAGLPSVAGISPLVLIGGGVLLFLLLRRRSAAN
jgi:hypothetical protein